MAISNLPSTYVDRSWRYYDPNVAYANALGWEPIMRNRNNPAWQAAPGRVIGGKGVPVNVTKGLGGGKGPSTQVTQSAKGVGGSLFKKGGTFDGGLEKMFGKFANPELDWTQGTGLKGWGHNLGGIATTGKALYDAYGISEGLSDRRDLKQSADEIMSDIVSASYNNPNVQYDLSSDQLKLLRELRRGTYDGGADFGDVDLLNALGGALKGGVSGYMYGGTTGAILGALGSAGKAAVQDVNNAQSISNSELEALYQAVLESERNYNDIKRQKAYTRLAGY